MTTRQDRMIAALQQQFSPTVLAVDDESARHAGHAGAAPGGQTHFNVLLVSAAFRGQDRITRSRSVHAVLDPEFGGGLHALSLTLRTPEEHNSAPVRR